MTALSPKQREALAQWRKVPRKGRRIVTGTLLDMTDEEAFDPQCAINRGRS